MICVSIGRGRHRHVIAEHAHLVEQGAELVELRLDYIRGDVNLGRLLDKRPGPVVATCRRQHDGGKWSGNEEMRLMLLRAAIAKGVEYIDLEEDIADKIPRFGPTKRIVSLHDFRKTPEDLVEVHARLATKDADIIKLATLANNPGDNVRMLHLIKESSVPTVGLCMGDMGISSRLLAGKFGAPFTYATFHHERALAPGQLSFEKMRELYHYDHINADTKIFGVIADPVRHSLSPLLHNTAFRQLGMNCMYIPFRVPQEYLGQFLKEAPGLGVHGLSVTIPHKEGVLPHLFRTDKAVQGIGAANTIVFQDEGLVGYNTDYRAAMESLEEDMKLEGEKTLMLRGKVAVVLGAGGAARAIGFGLIRRGAKVFLASRTKSRAVDLAHRLGCEAIDWSSRHKIQPQILVNCTPVGLHPDVDETPFNPAYLMPSMTVFDTVYNPENTLLIKQAREKHCKTITGVEMFVRQAALQFKIFTGQSAPQEALRETLKRATSAARH